MPTKDGWPAPEDFPTWEEYVTAHAVEQQKRYESTFWAAALPHTCWSCGFCGYRRTGTLERVEVLDADMRQTGELQDGMDLWCWQEQSHLPRETDESEETFDQRTKFYDNMRTKRSAAVREVLEKPRPLCVERKKWHGYRDGLDIKDHYDEWHTMQLEELRQQQTVMMVKIAEEQTKIAAEHARTAEAHKVIFERADRESGWFQRAFFMLALIALVLALAPLAYPSGLSWLTDHAPGAVRQNAATPMPQPTPATLRTP